MATAFLGPHPQFLSGPRTPSDRSEATVRAHEHQDRDRGFDEDVDYASTEPASPSLPRAGVVPHAPSPPSPTDSEGEIYGPDRLFGPPLAAQAPGQPVVVPGPGFRLPDLPDIPDLPIYPAMAYQPQPAWETTFNASLLTGFRDELAREAGVVTPGVDDTEYIHYALNCITRDRDTGYAANTPAASDEEGDGPRAFEDQHFGPYAPAPIQQLPSLPRGPQANDYALDVEFARQLEAQHARLGGPLQPAPIESQPSVQKQPPHGYSRLPAFQMPGDTPPGSLSSLVQPWSQRPVQLHEWKPINTELPPDFPTLTYRPRLLRPASFLALMILCLLMIAALVFSAVYSQLHNGLTSYVSTYGGVYFLFRFLPQILAALILIYTQCIVTTMFRILPFTRLASASATERDGAMLEDLYPKTFLWPQLIGPWTVWVPILVTWLVNFTVPLQSSVFTVILKDGVWTWATVQGVAWTLVALYLALFVSTAIAWMHWARVDRTGLLWDPRSLADICVMVSDTNTAEYYTGSKTAATRDSIRYSLRRRRDDQLGFWRWSNNERRPECWYAIGNTMDDANFNPVPGTTASKGMMDREKKGMMMGPDTGFSHDVENDGHVSGVRYRYLPWCLRNSPLLFFVVTAFILLLALFIVSFLPSTRVTAGFPPDLPAAPGTGAFSAADFLYSFLPALLGMILYLLFQSFDQALRLLQPWASLADPRGAPAEQTLLADYAACLPLQSTLHAIQNRHYRVAFISLLSTLFLLIPVSAGGTFMALTEPSGEVRIFPNVPAYAILLTLLVLYLLALVALLPGRNGLRLPHGVTCLAEVVGFLVNDELLADGAFKDRQDHWMGGREEMLRRMGMRAGTQETRPRWMFGFPTTEGAEDVLGVRRVRRFTEKRKVRKSQIRRDQARAPISSL